MTIKILLADDRCLMLEGIKAILKHEPEIEIIGTAKDGQSAISQVQKLRPDLVLMDIEMPKMNGIVATKYICDRMPGTKVIILTSHKEQSYVTQALQAGASGYLLKETLVQDLKQAIHSLGYGYSYIEAKLSVKSVDRIKAKKVIKYKEKIAYLQKYRRSIYKPGLRTKRQLSRSKANKRTFGDRHDDLGAIKANLTPISESPFTQKIRMFDRVPKNRQIYISPISNRQRQLRKITWMLLAIASFILSIILF